MKNPQFLENLRVLKQQSDEEPNPEEIRAEWAGAVTELLRRIEGWLSGAVEEGLATIERRTVEIEEDFIGRTELPSLSVRFPGLRILTVRPIGRLALGTRGRVDLESGTKRSVLLRDAENQWGVRLTGTSTLIRLDRDTFLDAVSRMITQNGE